MNVLKTLIYIIIGIIAIIMTYLLREELGILNGNNKKKYFDYLNKIKYNFKKYDESHKSFILDKIAEQQAFYVISETEKIDDIIKIRNEIIEKLDALINDVKKEKNKNLILNIILNAVFYMLGLITSLVL